jgi:hypothetical protein
MCWQGYHGDGRGVALIEQAQQAAAAQVARLEGVTDNEVWHEVTRPLSPLPIPNPDPNP